MVLIQQEIVDIRFVFFIVQICALITSDAGIEVFFDILAYQDTIDFPLSMDGMICLVGGVRESYSNAFFPPFFFILHKSHLIYYRICNLQESTFLIGISRLTLHLDL